MFTPRKGHANITPADPQFFVRYVGKVETFTAHGRGCTRVPVQKIWDSSEEERYLRKVAVTINNLGLMIQDLKHGKGSSSTALPATSGLSGSWFVDIKDISYCCAERSPHDQIFTWISKDENSRSLLCHALLCTSREEAKRMALALSQAFQVAYRDWKANREKVAKLRAASAAAATARKRLAENEKASSMLSVENGLTETSGVSRQSSSASDSSATARTNVSGTDVASADAHVISGDGSVISGRTLITSSTHTETDDVISNGVLAERNNLEDSNGLSRAMEQMNIVEEDEISFTENNIVVEISVNNRLLQATDSAP